MPALHREDALLLFISASIRIPISIPIIVSTAQEESRMQSMRGGVQNDWPHSQARSSDGSFVVAGL